MGEYAMCKKLQQRILRVFAIRRCWLGYYMIATSELMAGPNDINLVTAAMHRLYKRGQIIGSYDDGLGQGFWWYLWTGLLPSPKLLALRVKSCHKEGWIRCHA